MKMENKRAAQARRAEERKRQARNKILIQITVLCIILIVIILIYVVSVLNSQKNEASNAAESSRENVVQLDELELSEIVENGDTVNIDYIGYINGVAFNGGNTMGAGTDLTIGSGTYIDGFEDQLIGHKVGETFDITVTFPDGYGSTTTVEGDTVTLDNQEVVFTITINGINKLQ